jgi:hypothetical protein
LTVAFILKTLKRILNFELVLLNTVILLKFNTLTCDILLLILEVVSFLTFLF